MKLGLYRTLAWTGMKNNRKLYMPYLLTCTGTVMMCYIISFLSSTPTFRGVRGGGTMQSFLGMGFAVMCIFSLIFLFYTNSFLMRRRKREFGMYNILGLGKRNLALVLGWETLITAFITLLCGLFFGILFSKLAELCMVRILGGTVGFEVTVMMQPVCQTAILFAVIFALIYLNALRQIHLTNPIQLLRSENFGEKPPRANWAVAVIGALMLTAAYYIAVSVQDPLTAITVFFFAVVMVIIATYLLFIAGSVTLCRILQRNRRYYYKTNHFVSVSSMLYRMKRNGAGLASICILCTMVLVMLSSTVCMYIGTEDSLRNRYPRHINIDVTASDISALQNDNALELVRTLSADAGATYSVELTDVLDYRVAAFAGVLRGHEVTALDSVYNFSLDVMADVWQVFIVPLDDYNRLMRSDETLEPGEALIYTTKGSDYNEDTIRFDGCDPLTIRAHAGGFANNAVDAMQVFPSMFLFVPDFQEVVSSISGAAEASGQNPLVLHWYYGFDLECGDDDQIEIERQISEDISALIQEQPSEFDDLQFLVEGAASERGELYGLYGGLFFLGVLLGIVFIFAAVLIIYYKQVSEGYEDQSRFDIMQKVGMTKKEIQKSINSQVLTVFLLPLVTAGVHLAFAFPIIRKILLIFSLTNFRLLVMVTVGCYLIFALFYMVVYRMTSRSYFSIVSGMRGESE